MKESGIETAAVIAVVIVIAAVATGGYFLLKGEGEAVEAPAAWQLVETWTGTVEAPAAWQLIETWTGTIKPSDEALTLRELLEDFDENILEFKSYDSGDVVKVRDTVENTILISEHHWWENMFYENIIENTYNASYPITLIVVESCAENIWEGPLFPHFNWTYPYRTESGGGKVIGYEGDNFEIGKEVTIFIHIEKPENIEFARELILGPLLWNLLYWID